MVKKCSKLQLKQVWPLLRPDISQTALGMASNFCVKLWLEISNNFSKSGVWTANCAEILKVGIKIKFDLNSLAYISGTTIARTSKFYVVLWLELTNICPKSRVWDIHRLEMLKVRTKPNLTIFKVWYLTNCISWGIQFFSIQLSWIKATVWNISRMWHVCVWSYNLLIFLSLKPNIL